MATKVKTSPVHLDESDVATILVALRLFQNKYDGKTGAQIADEWPDHFVVEQRSQYEDGEKVTPMPLSTDDISALCERINCGKVLVLP